MAKSILIRRAPASAYNPGRPVSDLLKAHIRNLEAIAARTAPAGPRRKPKTEAQASAYIAELTRQIPKFGVPPDPAAAGAAPDPDAALALAALARRPRASAGKGRRKKTVSRKRAAAARRKKGQKAGKQASGKPGRRRATKRRSGRY